MKIYIYIYIITFFLGSLFSNSMNEKKKRVKKKKCRNETGWAIAHFCTWSRYSALDRDTGLRGMQQGGHDTAINPAARPHDTARRHATQPTCAHGLAVGCVARQATLRPCDTAWLRRC